MSYKNPKPLESLTFNELNAEDKLRWLVNNKCTCGYLPESEYCIPQGHYTGCPMKDENCESWDYIYWFDYAPQ